MEHGVNASIFFNGLRFDLGHKAADLERGEVQRSPAKDHRESRAGREKVEEKCRAADTN